MNRPTLWQQLKQRNVPRVAAFYAGVAWLLVQVATQVFPFFDIPNWAVRWVVVAAVLGFPLAVAFSWFYEFTPEGLRRESELAADASIARSSGRTLDRWIIGVLALAVVLLLTSLIVGRDASVVAPEAKTGGQSIAVLPFESLSDDHANAYFAQGIQDEILTRLSKVGSLRVASRTSAARFASRPEDVAAIARELGVDHVLEGSVQKAGDSVRINVQLIRAASDEHVWAEIYTRRLDDVFTVEGEVAQAIAEALDTRLTGAERTAVTQAPTRDQRAYDAYLRGLAYELHYESNDDYVESARRFTEAVQADPQFALAWAHLACVQSYLYLNGVRPGADSLALIRSAAETAMRLQPELGEAWLARGYFFYRGLRDFGAAIAAFQEAGKRLPNNPEVSAAIAYAERRQGRLDQALADLQRASQLDPQNVSYYSGAGEVHKAQRRYDAAAEAYARALELAPDNSGVRTDFASLYLSAGDLASAERLTAGLRADTPYWIMSRAQMSLLRRDYAGLIAGYEPWVTRVDLAGFGDRAPGLLSLLAAGYLFKNDAATARTWFEKAAAAGDALRARGIDTPELAQRLGLVRAALGDAAGAREEARRCLALNQPDQWALPGALVNQAQVEALLGDRDAALKLLQPLVDQSAGLDLGELRLSPLWDALRGDARFVAIVDAVAAKTRLPPPQPPPQP